VFEKFDLAGRMDAEQWYALESQLDSAVRILPNQRRGARQAEMPLDLDIVDFPERAKR
jgi:hypothetical protein